MVQAKQTLVRTGFLRQSDFLSGLPVKTLGEAEHTSLSPADRIRLIYDYISSIPSDGGLGIVPGSSEWDLVESIMALHDREFNDTWIRSWTPRHVASVQLAEIRKQVRLLVFPSTLGTDDVCSLETLSLYTLHFYLPTRKL